MIKRLLLMCCLLLLLGGLVIADPLAITVEVNSSEGSGVYTMTMPFTIADLMNSPNPEEVMSDFLENPVDIMDSATGTIPLATIMGLNLGMRYDPVVDLGFAVQAGSADTTFTISSTYIYFQNLNLVNPKAWATSGVTLPPDSNGATMTGNIGGYMYRASYDDNTYTRLTFDDELLGPLAAPPFTTGQMNDGTGGLWTIPGPVYGMGSMFHFTLSAYDQASGSSHYEIIPEPATTALLAFGGLALLLKRRK